jgi:hypothetical protein
VDGLPQAALEAKPPLACGAWPCESVVRDAEHSPPRLPTEKSQNLTSGSFAVRTFVRLRTRMVDREEKAILLPGLTNFC